MLFQSSVPALFDKMGMTLYNSATQARKAETAKKLNFYFDQQLERLEEQLAELFSEPEKMVKVSLNIVRKVITNLATVYFQPPVRSLENATEKDEQAFKQILEQSAFDVKLKQGQRICKLCGTILLRPVFRNNAIALDILTPNILDVICGDSPEKLEKVLITDYGTSDSIQDTEYKLWSVETFQRIDYRGNVIEEQPNPYKVLPFIPCFDYPPPGSNFWLSNFESLISIQEAINLQAVSLQHTIFHQSWGVGYVKSGSNGGSSLKVDAGTLVELPTDGEIGFVSQQSEIEAAVHALDQLIRWACVAQGLSSATMATDPKTQSGISKAWDNKELSEIRADDVALWRQYEKQLFNLIRIVHNTHNPGNKISDKATLSIDFADVAKAATSAKEQTATDDLKILQGVLSPVDIVMRDNPDIESREDALSHLLTIKQELQELGISS